MKSIFTKTAMFLAILLALTFGALGTIPAQARSFSYGVTTPTYYPFGPQANVDQSALTGWQACWTSDYSSTVSLDSILAACNGDYLLLAGGPSASTVFDVLAAAPRSDVLFDTGTGNTPHDANGSGWYYNSSWSWGFAPTGDVIDRNSCDVAAVYDGAGDQNLRLCWHTYSNNVNPGWSSGTNTSEFDPTYRRVIYQPSTTQTVTYDGNGSTSGSVPVDASSPYTPGATVTVLDNTGSLAKTGYTFSGWSTTDVEGGSESTYLGSDTFTMPGNIVTLYAQWTINSYTLTYTAGVHGSLTGTLHQTVNYGASGTAVTAVAISGYHFVVWSDGSTANPRTDTNVTASISVKASFLPEHVLNGGFNTYVGASKIPQYWEASNFKPTDGKDLTNHQEGTASVKIVGAPGVTKTLTQTIAFSGLAGDVFYFSFQAKGNAIPVGGVCEGQVKLYNGATLVSTGTINCATGIYGFQLNTLNLTAAKAYNKVVVVFTYKEASGTVWFDAASAASPANH